MFSEKEIVYLKSQRLARILALVCFFSDNDSYIPNRKRPTGQSHKRQFAFAAEVLAACLTMNSRPGTSTPASSFSVQPSPIADLEHPFATGRWLRIPCGTTVGGCFRPQRDF
jgi:hypothetical protein